MIVASNILLAAALCAGLLGTAPLEAQGAARSLIEEWRVDDRNGLVLMQPDLLATSNDGILVFDNGSHSLFRLDRQGRRIWMTGRKGSGPSEFGTAAGLTVTSKGSAVVLDVGNSRLAFVDSTGSVVRVATLPERILSLAPRGAGGLALLALGRAALLSASPDGTIQGSVPLPVRLTALTPLQREGRILQASGGRFVLVHRWSTAVFVFDSAFRQTSAFELSEPQEFPRLVSSKVGADSRFTVTRIDPGASQVVRNAAVRGDTLIVLDGRRLAGESRISYYSISAGSLLFSVDAPPGLKSFSVLDDRIVGVVDEPLPAVVSWRWSNAASGRRR